MMIMDRSASEAGADQDGVVLGAGSEPFPPFTGFVALASDTHAVEVLERLPRLAGAKGLSFEVVASSEYMSEGSWVALVSTDMGPDKAAGISAKGLNKKTEEDLSWSEACKTVAFSTGLWPGKPSKRPEDHPGHKMAVKIMAVVTQTFAESS